MINRKRTIRFLSLIIFASGLWWLSEFLSPPTVQLPAEVTKQSYDFRLTNPDTNQFDNTGRLMYALKASTLTHFPGKKVSHLRQPVLIQFAADGRTVETRSDTAVLNDNSEIIVMNGNVVTIQKDTSGNIQTRANTNQLTIKLQSK